MQKELTSDQRHAVASTSESIAVVAGAGSGKTRVLVERVAELVSKKQATLDRILAITFTEKAASELRHRVLKVIDDELALASSQIGTFHSFCANIIREHAPIIGIDPDFDIIEAHAADLLSRKAIKEVLLKKLAENDPSTLNLIEELELRETIACLDALIKFRWHTDRLEKATSLSDRESRLYDSAMANYRAILNEYDTSKQGNLDFSDLEIEALKILQNDDIRKRYQKKFKYILVDEFQDVNDTQAELIRLLHNPEVNNLTIVGDPKQSIYRFRGANVRAFLSTAHHAKEKINLKKNFRSRPKILDFINYIFGDFDPLVPHKEDTGMRVGVLKIDLPEDADFEARRLGEAKAIAGLIPSLAGETAILFSSLNAASAYMDTLSSVGIKYIVSGGSNFLDMQEIVDILNALRVAYDPSDVIALLGLARSPYIGLSDEELFMLARTCKKDRSDLFEKLSGHPKGTIISNLDRLKKSLSVSEMIVALANDRMTDNIGQLYNMVRSAEDQGLLDPPSIVSYLEDIRQRGLGMAEFPQSGKDAVIITTIHQAKGLEFDNVILADLFRGKISHNSKWLFVRGKDSGLSFKLTPEDNPVADAVPSDYFKTLLKHNEDADAEERRRLLYVAMTRAKERLFIPIHSEITRDGPWHKELSEKIAAYENIEWVIPASNSVIPAKAGIHLIQPESYNISPSLLPAPRSENGSSAMAAARHGSYSVSELEAYARSPQEYYANFVLGVPPDRPLDENSLPTNIHGDIVHKMIERLKRSTAITPEKLFANIIGEMNISSVSEKEKTAILAKVRLFLGTSHGAVKNSMHELPFMLKVGDDFVKGTIDMFVPASGAGDVWEIFDFKTGYLDDPTDALKKYDLQIRTYALAVTAGGLAKGNGRVTLLFLSDKGTTPISMDINEGVLKDTAEEINVIIKKVAEGFSLPQLMEP